MRKFNDEGTLVHLEDYLSYLKQNSLDKPDKGLTFTRLLGTHGSGKSEIFRQMLIQDREWRILCLPPREGSRVIQRVGTVFPQFGICVVGCYIKATVIARCNKEGKSLRELDFYDNSVFVTSGGMDGIDNNEVKEERIHLMWKFPYHLIIEGGIISSQDVFCSELHLLNSESLFKRSYVNLLIQPSLEVCLERIAARGGKLDPKNVRPKHKWFANKVHRLALDHNNLCIKLDSGTYRKEDTIGNILKVLTKVKNNNKNLGGILYDKNLQPVDTD